MLARRIIPSLLALAPLGLLAPLGACGGPHTHVASPIASLKSPDAGERRDAADDLRNSGGPTPEGTRALLDAIKTETDERAYGAMLISLGASGAPEAEPLICAKVYAPDARMRTYAKRALKFYLEHNRASHGCPPPGTPPASASTTATPTTSSPTPAPSDATGVPIGPK